MCLVTLQRSPNTATQDMIVYKLISQDDKSILISQDDKSMFREFQYQPNTLYRLRKPLKMTKDKLLVSTVEDGFHSYINFERATYEFTWGAYPGKSKIVKFIIPKGAKWLLSSDGGEVVSSSIRSGDLTHIQHLKDSI